MDRKMVRHYLELAAYAGPLVAEIWGRGLPPRHREFQSGWLETDRLALSKALKLGPTVVDVTPASSSALPGGSRLRRAQRDRAYGGYRAQ